MKILVLNNLAKKQVTIVKIKITYFYKGMKICFNVQN